MNWGMIRICRYLLLIAALGAATAAAQATDASRLTGSYQITHKTEAGGQFRVSLQLHLVNPTNRELHIQRITLWDFSHPGKGQSQACSVLVHSLGTASAAQEFVVSRPEYELWRRGARPRVVLEIATPNGQTRTEAVRLDRMAEGKVN